MITIIEQKEKEYIEEEKNKKLKTNYCFFFVRNKLLFMQYSKKNYIVDCLRHYVITSSSGSGYKQQSLSQYFIHAVRITIIIFFHYCYNLFYKNSNLIYLLEMNSNINFILTGKSSYI